MGLEHESHAASRMPDASHHSTAPRFATCFSSSRLPRSSLRTCGPAAAAAFGGFGSELRRALEELWDGRLVWRSGEALSLPNRLVQKDMACRG